MVNLEVLKESFFARIQHSKNFSDDERGKIYSAYRFSKSYFGNSLHKSGLSFVEHNFLLGEILLDLEVDCETLVVVFLHDLPKHTNVSYKEISEKFSESISNLVRGTQSLYTLRRDSSEHLMQDLDKVLIEMSKDLRIATIRLAHRLYDLKNNLWKYKWQKKALVMETHDIYIPIADRLGIRTLKSELENLCFKLTHPSIYEKISKEIAKVSLEDETCLLLMIKSISAILEKHNVKAHITGRLKTSYSIYTKMLRTKKPLHEVLDKIALRIMVDKIEMCYMVLGLIHTNFKPIPGAFDDYIGFPKPNFYQSIHTCIYPVPNASYKPVEIQIRTKEMDDVAEYGAAAHWKYKDGAYSVLNSKDQLYWIKNLLNISKKTRKPRDFIKNLKETAFKSYITIFDESGKVYHLQPNSTPSDFAKLKAIEECNISKSKINGRITEAKTQLKDGDTVEIVCKMPT